jgi:molybdenum cofactor biosynthesis enzyme MoaA
MKQTHLGNTSCGFVWSGVSTDTMGRLRPCCIINSPLADNNGEPYRIDKVGDFERFWSSSTMREIRKAGSENRWHELCFRCQEQEKNGSPSQRTIYNYLLPKEANPIPKIRVLNLHLSNKCNLKCRMCGPRNSHLIGREAQAHGLSKLWGNDVWGNDQVAAYSNPVSIDDDALVELVESYHDIIEELHFVGGEPFLSDTQHMILKKLVDIGVSDKITVSYSTNGTIPMDDYFSLWTKFKSVTVFISLEAINDLAHYIRYPTNWDTIERVMKTLDDASFSSDKIKIRISCLVQALNVLRVDELVEWMQQYKSVYPIPTLRTLVLPKHQHFRYIPQVLRIASAEKLENTMSKIMKVKNHDAHLKLMHERVKSTIDYIKTEPDAENYDEFIKFNRTLDRVRKTDLFAVLPELRPYIKDITND